MIDTNDRARVLDFGLALRHAAEPTPQSFAGSPPYMAPEQVRAAHVGPEADVYAIGVMLYEMLAGRRPFDAQDTTRVDVAVAGPYQGRRIVRVALAHARAQSA